VPNPHASKGSSAKAPDIQGGPIIALRWFMPAQALSVAALESSQDGPRAADARLVNLRSQAAVVRALADQAEQVSRAADVDGLGGQIVEEMAKLGCRLLDAAAELAEAPPVEESGIFPTMGWEAPTYELVRMDAEIGSYQEDRDSERETAPFVRTKPGQQPLLKDR
jgi:hypothetical protein